MGNWRRVQIVGAMLAEEIDALRAELYQRPRYRHRAEEIESLKKFGPLSDTGGLCGLGDWPACSINRTGNLAERDYSIDDVRKHLQRLSVVAPSLAVWIHCGGDYETDTCVASVVLLDGKTDIQEAQIKRVGEIPPEHMEVNLLRSLLGPYNRTL